MKHTFPANLLDDMTWKERLGYSLPLFLLAILGAVAMCSCSLFKDDGPDPFTELFNAVAAQSANQIRMTPPRSAAQGWKNWKLEEAR